MAVKDAEVMSDVELYIAARIVVVGMEEGGGRRNNIIPHSLGDRMKDDNIRVPYSVLS